MFGKKKIIEKKEKLLFATENLTKKELWLLGFAAPAATSWDIFPQKLRDFPVNRISERTKKEQGIFFFELSTWLGVETEQELLDRVRQYIEQGPTSYFDYLLPIFQEELPETWGDKAKKILPITENQIKKIKKLQDTFSYIKKYDFDFLIKTTCAFDLSRASRLLVLGYVAGILQKAKLFVSLETIAFYACQYYKTWVEYISGYLIGIDLWQWGRENFLSITYYEIYETQKILLTSEKSPYSFIKLNEFQAKENNIFSWVKLSEDFKKENFEIAIKVPIKTKTVGDPFYQQNYAKYEETLFLKRNAKPFECWLMGFAALNFAKAGMAVNGLILLEEETKRKLIKDYQEKWKVSNRSELLKKVQKLFIEGDAKIYDIVLANLVEKKDSSISDKNVKELENFILYLNRYGLQTSNKMRTVYAFDLVHIAEAIAVGYGVGYLLREEALQYLKRVAWSANQYYSSWNTYLGAYFLGKSIYLYSKKQYRLIEQCKEEIRIARVLLSSPKSVFLQSTIKEYLNLCEEDYVIYHKRN